MLPGSCRCLRSNVSSPILETAAAVTAVANLPAEPLLFLYPSWVSTLHGNATLRRALRGARRYHTWPGCHEGPLARRRKTVVPSSRLSTPSTRSCASTAPIPPSASHGDTNRALGLQEEAASQDAPAQEASSSSPPQCSRGQPNESTTRHEEPLLGFEDEAFPFLSDSNQEPLAVPSFDPGALSAPRFPHKPNDVQHTRKKDQQEVRWKIYVRELLELTTSLKGSNALRLDEETIEIPETTLAEHLGDVGETKFLVNCMDGCFVHCLPRGQDYTGPYRKLVLSGSPLARRITAQMLQRAAAKTRLKGNSTDPGSIRVWFTWDTSARKSQPQRADKMPFHVKRTIKDFTRYVEHLTTIPMTHSSHRLLYKYGEQHTKIVCTILFQLFKDPSNAPLISTRAVNLLIHYFIKHGALPYLDHLYYHIQPFMTTRTFNSLLKFAALSGDLQFYSTNIRQMKRAQLTPNGLTWATLLGAARSKDAKTTILTIMYKRDMLKVPEYLRAAIPRVLSRDYWAYLSFRSQNTADFIADIDSKFGPEWFSTAAAREMIWIARHFRDTASIQCILEHCVQRGIKVDPWTITQVLSHYVRIKDFVGGFKFLFYARSTLSLELNHEIMDKLFDLAWRCQAPNTLRVIWRYACLRGDVSWEMRTTVFQSLCRNVSKGGQLNTWDVRAGKVAVGVHDQSLEEIPEWKRFDELRKFVDEKRATETAPTTASSELTAEERERTTTDALDYLQCWTPTGTVRVVQRFLAKRIVDADLNAFGKCVPQESFWNLLRDAANTDIALAELIRTQDLDWLLRHTIKVPVRTVRRKCANSSKANA